MEYKVTATWLSRAPAQSAFLIAAFTTLLLVLGGIIYQQDFYQARDWMPATGKAVLSEGAYWQSWTALFAHSDEKHLLSNSFLFFILGSFLTAYFGTFVFPVMAIVFGGITNILVLTLMPPETRLLGASGVVFWLGGVWLTLYFLLDLKHSTYQRVLRTLGVALVLFFPAEAFDPQTSYSAHFIGFILGILFALFYFRQNHRRFKEALVIEPVPEETQPS